MAERILLAVVVVIGAVMGWLFLTTRRATTPSEIASRSVAAMVLSGALLLFVLIAAIVLYGRVIGGLG